MKERILQRIAVTETLQKAALLDVYKRQTVGFRLVFLLRESEIEYYQGRKFHGCIKEGRTAEYRA